MWPENPKHEENTPLEVSTLCFTMKLMIPVINDWLVHFICYMCVCLSPHLPSLSPCNSSPSQKPENCDNVLKIGATTEAPEKVRKRYDGQNFERFVVTAMNFMF